MNRRAQTLRFALTVCLAGAISGCTEERRAWSTGSATSFVSGATSGHGRPGLVASCSGINDSDDAFRRGMDAWYDFDFAVAHACFQRSADLSSQDLMPRLGLIVAHLRPLEGEIVDSAFAALAGIGPTPTVREREAGGDRDLGWLRALEELVPGSRERESLEHRYAEFANAMRGVWQRHPGDLDAAGVYVAALLASAGGRRDSTIYRRVEEAADSILAIDPLHRGALHFKIHAVDRPDDAERGLAAARAFARVAGDSNHAQHMPSHIFLALGRWPEVESANRRAWQVSRAAGVENGGDPDDHAVHWLIYALLQQGEEAGATAWMDSLSSRSIWGSEPNWFRVELARAALIADADSAWTPWAAPQAPLDALRGTGRATQAWASGVAAYRRGDRTGLLESVRALLDQGAAQSTGGDTFQDLLNLELGGLLRVLDGNCGEAVELWRRAAQLEDRRPYGFGPPNPAVPAGELLAAGLRCTGREAEAEAASERVASRYPGRTVPAWVAEIGVANDPEPRIDGRITPGEWAGAAHHDLAGGGEVMILAGGSGGDLFLGIQGPGPGWAHVYLARSDTVWVLHASAALGDAIYVARGDGSHGLQSGFEWHLRDPGQEPAVVEQRADFLRQRGWLANVGRMGDPTVREFRIASRMLGDSARLAVVYAEDAEQPLSWPGVTDAVVNTQLVFGDAPQTLRFRPATWAEATDERK